MIMTSIDKAIRQTVAYADLFDYPMEAGEIHRYLWGITATHDQVSHALKSMCSVDQTLSCSSSGDDGAIWYTLPGREWVGAIRRRREANAKVLWVKALRYAHLIGLLPFVRMVAVTGSLAVGNIDPKADIDYLIVTRPGRLWLCRAAIIALTKVAALQGDTICPNYLLSETSLLLKEQNFYTAHEFTQMVPLYGMSVYHRMQTVNEWIQQFLPNATGSPPLAEKWFRSCHWHGIVPTKRNYAGLVKRMIEGVLQAAPGAWLEQWEMNRKLRKFTRHHAQNAECSFSPECCKGHFHKHMTRTLTSLSRRLGEIEPELSVPLNNSTDPGRAESPHPLHPDVFRAKAPFPHFPLTSPGRLRERAEEMAV